MHKIKYTLLLLAAFLMASCEIGLPAGSEPFSELNYTDMGNQPKLKPQRQDLFGSNVVGMIAPAEGAIALGEQPYRFFVDEFEKAAAFYKNPLKPDAKVLEHGKWIFDNYCIVCHGPKAAGDGHLTKLFPKPPSLMRQKVRDFSDGRIYHIANRGQGSMPSYAKQLESKDIWSVIHYIRKLQLELPVALPTKDDLKELAELKAKQDAIEALATPVDGEPAGPENITDQVESGDNQ